ncbi:fimbrial biogenesis outer membrane usher protein [Pseudomonas sp. C2L12B]|uniref:Fimbrial biogenesis outer membrane usher protein n=1 Tax=Pseudomonas typographi TaxID=2715964 RepID=A0ABR7Z2H7_9PSED|nr:fimbria/pilus outer membrane usher protein [Pseudomonas typographi]MBD1585933.1 fimbrial biogenesis outer membrane usher protein [Pseudomonas typographi]MBD1599701.1 fimbrial biogenesis outer membrane usher protein [Pseudomonas typographi]
MARRRRRHVNSARLLCVPLCFIATLMAWWANVANAADTGRSAERQILLLNVLVNGNNRDNVLEFTQVQGAVLVNGSDLANLGLILPENSQQGLVDLASIPGWSYQLDLAAQSIRLQIPSSDLVPHRVSRKRAGFSDLPLKSDPGAMLNYDAQATRYGGQISSSTLVGLRFFSDRGVFETDAQRSTNPYRQSTVRLDSTYTYSDVVNLRTYNVGDFINGGLSWSRPVRMAGAQIATNFGLRPDLVTFPLPGISGNVAVPSSVDVFVNGLHQLTSRVDSGPFEVSQLPVSNGGGDISMVVKDANGREVSQTLPFYASTALLQPGLGDMSVEVGSVRRHYASASNDYSGGAASVSYRRGITPVLTLESHLESTSGLAMGGIGSSYLVGNLGVLSATVAASEHAGGAGLQYGLGFSHVTPSINYGFSILQADGQFSDIASVNGDAMPRTTLRANLGIPLPGIGSFGLVYAKKLVNLYELYDFDDRYVTQSESIHTSTLSATFSTRLPWKTFGFITTFHDFEGASGNGFFVGISIPIGQRATASASSNVSGGKAYQTVQAQQNAVQQGDVGWRVARQTGDQNRQTLGVEYKTPWALVGAETETGDDGDAFRASARGAITTMDGHLFASNSVNDSFAIVDTDGQPGVMVLQENRPVGRTNASGILFVEDLRAYESNLLAIDANDVPIDAALDNVERRVRPRDRAGVVVKFPISRSYGATLRLVDEQHRPIALGSQVTLNHNGAQGVVGYDGLTFFDGLAAHNELVVEPPGKPACHVAFDYQPQANSIPEIGPLTCSTGGRP